jgi:hypothetical protein
VPPSRTLPGNEALPPIIQNSRRLGRVINVKLPNDASRLQELLLRFAESPVDPRVPSLARDLATRHTMDQLEAMAEGDCAAVRALFERLLGRAGL